MIGWVLTDNGTELVVALFGVIGVLSAAWVASDRRTKRVDRKVDVLVESVGVKNGHGTTQDQGAAILAELAAIRSTQHSMQTSLDSVVDAAGLVADRLKHHDREHQRHRKVTDDHEDRLVQIERRTG